MENHVHWHTSIGTRLIIRLLNTQLQSAICMLLRSLSLSLSIIVFVRFYEIKNSNYGEKTVVGFYPVINDNFSYEYILLHEQTGWFYHCIHILCEFQFMNLIFCTYVVVFWYVFVFSCHEQVHNLYNNMKSWSFVVVISQWAINQTTDIMWIIQVKHHMCKQQKAQIKFNGHSFSIRFSVLPPTDVYVGQASARNRFACKHLKMRWENQFLNISIDVNNFSEMQSKQTKMNDWNVIKIM